MSDGAKPGGPLTECEKPISPAFIEKGDLGALERKWRSNGELGMTLAKEEEECRGHAYGHAQGSTVPSQGLKSSMP